MAEVFVGVGSNVDRERNIRAGLAALREAFGELRCSTVWDNPAEGFDGDDFLNLVVAFHTDEPPRVVSGRLHTIESGFGRERGDERFVARALDLDLLLHGDTVADEPGLRLPRPDILEYAFVLAPLAELAPDLRHPVDGRTYADLWRDFTGRKSALKRAVLPTQRQLP